MVRDYTVKPHFLERTKEGNIDKKQVSRYSTLEQIILIFLNSQKIIHIEASKNTNNRVRVASIVLDFNVLSNKRANNHLSVFIDELLTELTSVIKSEMRNKWQGDWIRGSNGRHYYNVQKKVRRKRETSRTKKTLSHE